MARRSFALSLLTLALVPAASHAFVLRGSSWPGRPATITYFNATAYASAVRVAASAWNHSGARVRFVAAPRSRAHVVISYGSTLGGIPGGVAGFATIGKQPGSYVHLTRGGHGSAIVELIAHELGHVLGLDHETRRCATMNTTLWDRCKAPPPCAVLQPDDVRGAIRRYGGHARGRAPTFCPGPPAAPSVQAAPSSYGVTAAFRMPKSPFVAGYVWRVQRDSCAPKPGSLGVPVTAEPSQHVQTDITPPGDPFGGGAGDYCLTLWSQGELDRVGARSVKVRFHWAPDPIPPPASVTGVQSEGTVTLSWARVAHDDLAGYVADAGASCPAAPGPDATKVLNGATSAQVYTTGRGPTCFAVWSVDRYGHRSPTAATVVLDLAGTQPPNAAFTPDFAYGTVGDPSATVQFTDASTDPDGHVVAWSWDFGDSATGTGPSPSHAYTQAGDYTVTLTVTDEDGLTSQAYGSVSISSA